MNNEKQTQTIGSDTKFRTSLGSLIAVILAAASMVAAWTWLNADVRAHSKAITDHGERISTMEKRWENDHDILIEIRADLKALRRENKE